jgi:hypothetical protein
VKAGAVSSGLLLGQGEIHRLRVLTHSSEVNAEGIVLPKSRLFGWNQSLPFFDAFKVIPNKATWYERHAHLRCQSPVMAKGIVRHPVGTPTEENEKNDGEAGSDWFVLEIPTGENYYPAGKQRRGCEQRYPQC